MELTKEQKKALDRLIIKSPPLQKLAPKEYEAFEKASRTLIAKYKDELTTVIPVEEHTATSPLFNYVIMNKIIEPIVNPTVSYYIITGVEIDALKQIAKEALIERTRTL